jgi:uridine kinase
MPNNYIQVKPSTFSEILYEKMIEVNPGISAMEQYEFRYALNNLEPPSGDWSAISLESMESIEAKVNDIDFYQQIQINKKLGERIIFDPAIVSLTNTLLAGIAWGEYPIEWVNQHFYFDIRGFYFLHRTHYFNKSVLKHLGGHPFRQFEKKQASFITKQDIGYKEFQEANAEVDQAFISSAKIIIARRGTPCVLAIAGPTAAGKTEIVERLRKSFMEDGLATTSIELDNFLTDRDYREKKGIHTQGKEALHYSLLLDSLEQICQGKKILTPRYDFVYANSSHDLDGHLKPDGIPVEVEPADIIFIEGNFPFLFAEVARFIQIKVVYHTDDHVRMKRKWKRDIDYRKKYEPTYFRNRFFKDQFIMAQIAYIPQMECCDMLVDTTGAALWVSLQTRAILESSNGLKLY